MLNKLTPVIIIHVTNLSAKCGYCQQRNVIKNDRLLPDTGNFLNKCLMLKGLNGRNDRNCGFLHGTTKLPLRVHFACVCILLYIISNNRR